MSNANIVGKNLCDYPWFEFCVKFIVHLIIWLLGYNNGESEEFYE